MAIVFPFTAIVGQDEMKLALLIAAVDPTVGGVLVFGDRGTGKSTAVRALAGLLGKGQKAQLRRDVIWMISELCGGKGSIPEKIAGLKKRMPDGLRS